MVCLRPIDLTLLSLLGLVVATMVAWALAMAIMKPTPQTLIIQKTKHHKAPPSSPKIIKERQVIVNNESPPPPPPPPQPIPYFPFNQDTRLRGYEWVRVGFVFQEYPDEKTIRLPLFARAKDYQRGLFEYRVVDGSRNRIPINVERIGRDRHFELQSGDRVKIPGNEGRFIVEIQEDNDQDWLVPGGYRRPGQLFPRWS